MAIGNVQTEKCVKVCGGRIQKQKCRAHSLRPYAIPPYPMLQYAIRTYLVKNQLCRTWSQCRALKLETDVVFCADPMTPPPLEHAYLLVVCIQCITCIVDAFDLGLRLAERKIHYYRTCS